MSLRRRWLPILLAGVFVMAMVAAAGALRCPEVLFPETAAILCGAWIQPHQAWNVNRPRMIALMCAGAVFGTAVNLLLPWPLWLRAPLGFLFCATLMNVAGADMTPVLSAAILPMVLGTREWAYPVAVAVLVSLVCAGQVALEHLGLREKIDFRPFRLPLRQTLLGWGRRFLVFCVLACPAFATGNAFLAVPPLLVAYTELTRPDMTLRLRPRRTWCTLPPSAASPETPSRRSAFPPGSRRPSHTRHSSSCGTACACGCRRRAPSSCWRFWRRGRDRGCTSLRPQSVQPCGWPAPSGSSPASAPNRTAPPRRTEPPEPRTPRARIARTRHTGVARRRLPPRTTEPSSSDIA